MKPVIPDSGGPTVSAKIRIPSLRQHKPSGQAVVSLGGKDVYLGPYGSPESKRKYQQVVGEWMAKRPTAARSRARDQARPDDRRDPRSLL